MLEAIDLHGLLEAVEDVVGEHARIGRIPDVRTDDDELVTAEARNAVGLPARVQQPVRHFLEDLVAHLVAEQVVHHLEPVQIQEEERQRAPRSLADRQVLLQAIVEQRAVEEARERVVHGLVRVDPGQAIDQAPVLVEQPSP